MKTNLLVSSVLAAGMMVFGQAHAQTAPADGGRGQGPAAPADHGQAVRTTAQDAYFSGADRGAAVGAQASQGRARQAESEERAVAVEAPQLHPDNHGLEVSTTARETELTGQAKGAAVSAAASQGRSVQRGNSNVGRAHRPVRTARATRPGERSVTNRAVSRSSAAQGRRGRAH